MIIKNQLVVQLYLYRMKKYCNDYSLMKFKDYQEIGKLILKSKSTIKIFKLRDDEVFNLSIRELRVIRIGLRECNNKLFNIAYKKTMEYVFESIYTYYIENGEYEKLYEQCYRRALLSELMKTIKKFGNEKEFIGIY